MKEYKTLYKQRWVKDRRTGRAPLFEYTFSGDRRGCKFGQLNTHIH